MGSVYAIDGIDDGNDIQELKFVEFSHKVVTALCVSADDVSA